jgi:hypothetical protein
MFEELHEVPNSHLVASKITLPAASNTPTHDIQLMGKDESWATSFTQTPVNWTGDVGSSDFNSAQYGSSDNHFHHHNDSQTIILT